MRLIYLLISIGMLMVGIAGFLIAYPQTPLPDAWNPIKPLKVDDRLTALTDWKLARALGDDAMCLAALETGATFEPLDDFNESAQCHIRPQVKLRRVGALGLNPLNTRCQTALRMAMWAEHGITPAATEHLGAPLAEIVHLSSYNCRQIRTTRGPSGRMSTHATADAVDISGFVTQTGQRVMLLQHWNDDTPRSAFLKAVRDSACKWFRLTLGPDYNALHADHFHLQHTGWGGCR